MWASGNCHAQDDWARRTDWNDFVQPLGLREPRPSIGTFKHASVLLLRRTTDNDRQGLGFQLICSMIRQAWDRYGSVDRRVRSLPNYAIVVISWMIFSQDYISRLSDFALSWTYGYWDRAKIICHLTCSAPTGSIGWAVSTIRRVLRKNCHMKMPMSRNLHSSSS